MNPDLAAQSLEQAARVSATTSRAGAWLVRYFAALGAGSLVLALGVGLADSPAVVVGVTMAWVALVVAVSVYATTRQVAVRGTGALVGVSMGLWAAAWGATVAIGSAADLGWWWWLGGGLVMLAICGGAAGVARRRTRGTVG